MPQHRFDTPGPVTVTVRTRSGTIDVRSHDKPVTEVEVVTSGSSGLAEHVAVEHSERAGRHEVRVTVPSERGGGLADLILGRDSTVYLTLRVPHGSSLDLSTSSATTRATGQYETVSVTSASGDVDLDEVSGQVDVRTASGDVAIARAGSDARVRVASGDVRCGRAEGRLEVTTASGDVMLGGCGGPAIVVSASGDVVVDRLSDGCRIRTASGDVRVGCVEAGETRLEAVTGDISVGIARGATVTVDATSITGDLSSEIDFDDGVVADSDSEVTTRPIGHVDLTARTTSGDIAVLRAAGSPVDPAA